MTWFQRNFWWLIIILLVVVCVLVGSATGWSVEL